MSKRIQAGDRLPDVRMTLDDGRSGTLLELAAGRPVVVFFYPKDFTPVCTQEACGFRDNWGALSTLDAFVVGVSDDSEERHREFRAHYSLPFALATDDGSLSRAFGIPEPTFKFWKPRVTFAADRAGIVKFVCDSKLVAASHVNGAIAALREASAR